MTIYHILTPDNVDEYMEKLEEEYPFTTGEWQKMKRTGITYNFVSKHLFNIIKQGSIFINTSRTYGDAGIIIDTNNQVITQLPYFIDKQGIKWPGYTYKFTPSELTIRVDPLDPFLFIEKGGVHIEEELGNMSLRRFLGRPLVEYLEKLVKNQTIREVLSISNLGRSRALPEDVEGVIGEYVSGKQGPIPSQINQLKQNRGISLAPRIRKGGAAKFTRRKRRSKSLKINSRKV